MALNDSSDDSFETEPSVQHMRSVSPGRIARTGNQPSQTVSASEWLEPDELDTALPVAEELNVSISDLLNGTIDERRSWANSSPPKDEPENVNEEDD